MDGARFLQENNEATIFMAASVAALGFLAPLKLCITDPGLGNSSKLHRLS